MAKMKKKKKPSKRGKKAKKDSLHCTQEIISHEKKIIKWTRYIKVIVNFLKVLHQAFVAIKPLIEWFKSLFDLV